MKTNLKLLMSIGLLMLLTNASFAQIQSETLAGDVDSEIDQMYQPAHKSSQRSGPMVTQTMIMPQQSVQKQPITVVEASPLSDSRADNIRKNRQDEEMRTESKIVEKLEQSRMEDEKRRSAILFGDKFDNLQNGQPAAQQPVMVQPIQAPVSQIQPQPIPQPIVVQQNETLSRDAVREEVRAALDEDTKAVTPMFEQKYFAGIAGIGNYADSNSIKGNYSLGVAFGSRSDLFLVEGSFLVSNYSVTGIDYTNVNYLYPLYIQDFYSMNQYQGLISAKYQLLSSFVRPYIGGLISYSYRTYEANYDYFNYGAATRKGNIDVTSHAIDLGTDVGVDLEFNERTAIGASFKYYFNMSSRINGSTSGNGTSIEKQSYYQAGLHARVNF